jgi:nicotinic acid mononucleotide adenylyltransferase
VSQPSPSARQLKRAAYVLNRLFSLREAITSLDPSAPPQVRVISSGPTRPYRRVGILCGSFNPLTLAHSQLAEQVCQTWQLDQVFLSLATLTVDKEQVTGLGLEDRLVLLSLYAAGRPSMSVALVNRGLYVEQAQAFRRLLGADTELCFLTGMDKLVQILDPRYYQDRDAALHELFGLACLIVANRGELDQTAFRRLLAQPENQAFRSAIRFFPLSTAASAINDLSATAIRHALAAGRSIHDHVPAETAHYLNETRAYQPPELRAGEAIDAYALRLALIRLLYSARPWAQLDFRRLMQVALAASPQGRTLRQACTEPSPQAALGLLRAYLQ